MTLESPFILERDAIMRPYTKEVASYCEPFRCDDTDLDDFLRPMLSIMMKNYLAELMLGLILMNHH